MKGRNRTSTFAWQLAICVVVLSVWQWGYDLHAALPWLIPDLLDPYFISKPSDIFGNFLILSCIKSKMGVFNGWLSGDFTKCLARNQNNLWVATAITLKNTFFGFVTGAAIACGRTPNASAMLAITRSIGRPSCVPLVK